VLLAVDIGNTNIVYGLYSGAKLLQTYRVSTMPTRTADEHAVLLWQLLEQRGWDPKTVDAAIVASVVPPQTDLTTEAIRHAFARDPMIVGPGVKTGVAVLYDNPRDVGADRIVNAVAAFERFKSGVIVVDFGTATTFDCVSPKAEYLGGVIVPGVAVSLDALLGHAAKLSRIEIAEPPRVVGQNTTHSLQSGIVYGYSSLVDGVVRKIQAELSFPCALIATGGLAPLIVKHTETVHEVDEHLTLEGLRLLYERNSARDPGKSRP
jgi:type III pantothenate kinase